MQQLGYLEVSFFLGPGKVLVLVTVLGIWLKQGREGGFGSIVLPWRLGGLVATALRSIRARGRFRLTRDGG